MADDLEVRRHVLELLGDVRADLAQPAAAGGAAAGAGRRVVVRGRGLGAMHLLLTRQVRGQAAVDLCGVGRSGLGRRAWARLFIQWCAFDQGDLGVIEAARWSCRTGRARAAAAAA